MQSRGAVIMQNAGQKVIQTVAGVIMAFGVAGVSILIKGSVHADKRLVNVFLHPGRAGIAHNGRNARQHTAHQHHIAVGGAAVDLLVHGLQTLADDAVLNGCLLLSGQSVITKIIHRSHTLGRPGIGGIRFHFVVGVGIQPVPVTPKFPTAHLYCIADGEVSVTGITRQRISKGQCFHAHTQRVGNQAAEAKVGIFHQLTVDDAGGKITGIVKIVIGIDQNRLQLKNHRSTCIESLLHPLLCQVGISSMNEAVVLTFPGEAVNTHRLIIQTALQNLQLLLIQIQARTHRLLLCWKHRRAQRCHQRHCQKQRCNHAHQTTVCLHEKSLPFFFQYTTQRPPLQHFLQRITQLMNCFSRCHLL